MNMAKEVKEVKEVKTKFHGKAEITASDIWSFEQGLPGFQDEEQFVLLPIGENSDFQVLQSLQEQLIAFIVANPYKLVEDYDFELDETTIEQLAIEKPEDVAVLSIVSLKEPFEQSTINLQAPLIFQTANKKAKQVILNDRRFAIKHPITKKG